MKKWWTAAAVLVWANTSFAAAEKKSEPAFDGKPAIAMQILDISGKVARPIKGTTLSISKKQNRLCWSSVNVPTVGKVMVAEAFYAPSEFKIFSEGSEVRTSPDKKSHTVVTHMNQVGNQNITRCWNFDESDPKGKYQMEIQINNQVFKGLSFEIVK